MIAQVLYGFTLMNRWIEWDDVSAAGVIASAAHTAYHLGAIRQLIAGFGDETKAARAPE